MRRWDYSDQKTNAVPTIFSLRVRVFIDHKLKLCNLNTKKRGADKRAVSVNMLLKHDVNIFEYYSAKNACEKSFSSRSQSQIRFRSNISSIFYWNKVSSSILQILILIYVCFVYMRVSISYFCFYSRVIKRDSCTIMYNMNYIWCV